MDNKNNLTGFILRNIHLFILSSAVMLSICALTIVTQFDTTRLNTFGPVAQIYFTGIKNGLIVAMVILLMSFLSSLLLGKYFSKVQSYLRHFYTSLSNTKKNILILAICIAFTFASHAPNIMNGYFNMDDFEIIGINHTTSFRESLLIPHGNDHTMPLFMAEMRAIDSVFGLNQNVYNGFVFILFALIPFFTFLTFKRLRLGMLSFTVFLIIFSGATGWADILTGFNIMSTYTQIILFFSIALWAYVAWAQTKEKKYMAFFTASIICAVTIDLPGIWVLPAIFFLMICTYWMKNETFKIKKTDVGNFLKENKTPLLLTSGITIAFAIFFIYTFTVIQPNTFLSSSGYGTEGFPSLENRDADWKLAPLTANFLSFFTSGISIPLFAPNIVKILTHPVVRDSAKSLWPIVEIIILAVNAILFWLAFRYAENRERKFIIFLMVGMFITISMVILARPNHEAIPDFDYRYTGMPFYFYSICLTLFASLLLKTKKDYAVKIIIPIVIVIFSAQQAFSFHAVRLTEEAKLRKEAIINLDKNLLSELSILSKQGAPLLIPNLSGENIFEPMPGFSLANYLVFFNKKMPIQLIQNSEMAQDSKTHIVTTVSSLRASTSKEFKEALKKSLVIRSYYNSLSLMRYETVVVQDTSTQSITLNENKEIVIQKKEFDPEKKNTLGFSLYTDDTKGNLVLSLSFKNDFGIEEKLGKIRVDDYTPYIVKDGKRLYHIETNLLQLYTYSLSEKISNLTLYIPETKKTFVEEVYFR
ncbi:MAG: hypothetical protein AAB706_01745 [Patescibacteria group bacterium]